MADRNSYLSYKRDTRYLLYWMIHNSNSILRFPIPDDTDPDIPSIKPNTTGALSVSSVVPVCRLIAKHGKPTPPIIFRLFQSVIASRKTFYTAFQQIVSKKPDPEIKKSNDGHRRFIEVLTEAFEALGGSKWASSKDSRSDISAGETIDDDLFRNQFSSLDLGGSKDEDEDAEEELDPTAVSVGATRASGRSKAKGKKNGKGGKAKKKLQPAAPQQTLKDVPLESYRIIEGEHGLRTEYLMAVNSVLEEWIKLRHYVQSLWRDVAYSKLNSAVAGTMSNIAIAMVKQTESAVFLEFPGHESYQVIMNTITRGNPDVAQGMFHISLMRISPLGEVETGFESDINVREQFFIHAYTDLVDFVKDFQKTRSGKPTDTMMSTIYKSWDPKLNLQTASEKQRLKWRRTYTIYWLYDLINVFSAIVRQRISMKGQKWVLENIDWSTKGPWSKHRRLFGLNEFAGEITTLAMQKHGGDIEQRIRPHHVFQLQCIVDSMTVSRGWSINYIRGHVLNSPAIDFRPRRDVDLFLDRENKHIGRGFLQSVDIITQVLEKDAMLYGDPDRVKSESEVLTIMKEDFIDWLGDSKYRHGLTNIPPSLFSSTNANGLHEYSPFSCGVGLAEGLDLAYALGNNLWDRLPEPMCVIHLHNMMVELGLIRETGLLSSLAQLFADSFFREGKAPKEDFIGALNSVCASSTSRQATFQRKALQRSISRTVVDIHDVLNSNVNTIFRQKSWLQLYREADWLPERINEADIFPVSSLASLRITQAKISRDPLTGKESIERTPLIARMEAAGISNEKLVYMSQTQRSLREGLEEKKIPEELLAAAKAATPEGYEFGRTPKFENQDRVGKDIVSGRDLLEVLKMDIAGDVSGSRPLSSFNYIAATFMIIVVFHQLEAELKKRRNPLYIQAYEENPTMMKEKRLSLTVLILSSIDEECLQVLAKVFEETRSGFMGHVYWDKLDVDDDGKPEYLKTSSDDEMVPSCAIM
ncbi:uncharacterized protein RSE6_13753 [Rhynchosporium secalis]|uniref:DUF6604 domain-containing protein n=1 Tax=Rhynchosporium secalis TaxID=38038 RepID=A0A1E1MTK3_RHYSE|nr:uncharacterized protein RSE6_13753 [Rhynchosporium secalis]